MSRSKRPARRLPPVAVQDSLVPTELTTEQAVFLDIFGQAPVAFHRVFVDITGSVVSALWLSNAINLISQIIQSSPRGGEATLASDVWFSLSSDDCHATTGLSRREQETARESLRELGMLFERRGGFGLAKQYQIDFTALATRLRGQSAAAWGIGNAQLAGTTAPSATAPSSRLNSAAT